MLNSGSHVRSLQTLLLLSTMLGRIAVIVGTSSNILFHLVETTLNIASNYPEKQFKWGKIIKPPFALSNAFSIKKKCRRQQCDRQKLLNSIAISNAFTAKTNCATSNNVIGSVNLETRVSKFLEWVQMGPGASLEGF